MSDDDNDNDVYSSPFWIVAIAAVVIAVFTFLTGTKYMVSEPPKAPKQPDYLEAPSVVGGWHTVTGRPNDGYVCGWHQVPEPVYLCVRMKACQ
jgi:hypothetical protein